jgi:hypothetical protein
MNIEDLTIKQARELAAMFGGATTGSRPHTALQIGGNVIIRTVTHYYTGRVINITDLEVVLDDAAWIADTGRWSEALSSGVLSEVEPYPGQCCVMLGAMIDHSNWPYPLPREKK